MNPLTIVPLEPLVFGDGRPFGTEPGAQAAGGLTLPMPSTLAGAIRTAVGRAQSTVPTPDFWRETLGIQVHGPLLERGGEVFVPAPSDMATMEDKASRELCLVRSFPSEFRDGEGADLPGLKPCLLPNGADGLDPSKKGGPHWMSLAELESWYSGGALWGRESQDGVWRFPIDQRFNGLELPLDSRAHVAINPGTLAHEEGMLYTTLSVAYGKEDRLLVRSSEGLSPCMLPLGGERRTASLRTGESGQWAVPESIRRSLSKATKVAMVLATPGCFDNGWRPESFKETLGLDAELVSAVCRRRTAVSGWDYAKRRPKPVRWLAPAGSVYHLEIPAGAGELLADRWLLPVSDDPQSRLDGFGLAMFFPTEW